MGKLDFLQKALESILKIKEQDVAILLAILGLPFQTKSINGFLKRGYGISKDKGFAFTLPDDFIKERSRYFFNFVKTFGVIVIIIIVLSLLGIS